MLFLSVIVFERKKRTKDIYLYLKTPERIICRQIFNGLAQKPGHETFQFCSAFLARFKSIYIKKKCYFGNTFYNTTC